jgi:transcriptional regulator with XRE-family HTH domain
MSLKSEPSEKSTAPLTPLLRGSRLKARRKELGMTQRQLAHVTGIDVKLIRAYEHDRVQPRTENRRLLLEALDGTWPEESAEGGAALALSRPPGDAAKPTKGAGCHACVEGPCAFRDATARLVGLHEARILVTWTDENGGLAALAAGHDNRLLAIRANILPASLNDVRLLRGLVDRLSEQMQGPSREGSSAICGA